MEYLLIPLTLNTSTMWTIFSPRISEYKILNECTNSATFWWTPRTDKEKRHDTYIFGREESHQLDTQIGGKRALEWALQKTVLKKDVHRTGSGSYPMVGVDMNCSENSGSHARKLSTIVLISQAFCKTSTHNVLTPTKILVKGDLFTAYWMEVRWDYLYYEEYLAGRRRCVSSGTNVIKLRCTRGASFWASYYSHNT
jgi:hypothetical protein